MNDIKSLLEEYVNEQLSYLIVSRPRDKKNPVLKLKVRPVIIKEQLKFQETSYKGAQVFHNNFDKAGIINRIVSLMETDYVQIELGTAEVTATGLVNRKGEVSLKIKSTGNSSEKIRPRTSLEHNRTKNYILKEGRPVGFLIDLGLMTEEGRIIKSGYDKYRQINRFLEFVEDITDNLPHDREIRILDFGCGKSYLTFAVYYYLKELKGLDVSITGLDLKEDVIDKCNALKDKYGYEKLRFVCGDVAAYDPYDENSDEGKTRAPIDMMMTLHACDTATDYALYNAIRWGASVIMSVPCCQHEVNKQIDSTILQPVMKYGIIKERMSALITDGVRAELLRACGYDVGLLEFIDMEHTPKNILIRAIRTGEKTFDPNKLQKELCDMLDEMKIKPMLYRLLTRP